MSITYRPPFDEDDERDLRALYRKPGPGANPELDAAVRRRWHPGRSWHPGWGAAACAVMVAGLFAWTDMREAIDDTEPQMQLVAVQAPTRQRKRPPRRRPRRPAMRHPCAASSPCSRNRRFPPNLPRRSPPWP